MKFNRTDYRGDPSIGLFINSTDSYRLGPNSFGRQYKGQRISGTEFFGMLTAGNSNGLLLPSTTKEHEEKLIKDALDQRINVKILDSNETALGNLVSCNDSGCIISRRLEAKQEEIENVLEAKSAVSEVAGCPTPGSLITANNRGAVIHRDSSEEEAEEIKQVMKLEDIAVGTVNTGSPFIGSGSEATDSEIVFGNKTTGPELSAFDRTLSIKD